MPKHGRSANTMSVMRWELPRNSMEWNRTARNAIMRTFLKLLQILNRTPRPMPIVPAAVSSFVGVLDETTARNAGVAA